ncbi:MAG: Tetratricopeptide repeat-like domain [Gemmatimonadales bacterium]|nr:Tetratricopeptide repeat-like domain [Gemmatimonadales bacterium]
MATTVEPTRAGPTPIPVATTPWYQRHQRYLLAGIVILAVLALAAWFIMASGRRKEEFAARSLNQARAAAEAGNLPLASSELQRLISAYKGTDAASEGVITLNQVRMVNGQSELAAVGLREFLASKPNPKYVAPATGLLAAALENSRHWVEAADAYTQASNASDVEYLKAKYLVDAGRAFREGGKPEDAAKAYRTVLQKYPKAPSVTEAEVRLAELTDGKM